MICSCKEWAPNIEKVMAPLMFMIARNPATAPHYDGVVFRFCPWCGNRLFDETANEFTK